MQNVKLKHGTWVMVADGEKALFLRNEGDMQYPNLEVIRVLHEDNPSAQEQVTDRPGRFNDGPGVHRGAVEETDWHRLSKERFAEEITQRLYKLAHKGDFDNIVLVAPPLVLGEMRKKLHKMVGDRVIAEIPKTLTNHALPEIESILQAA
jgi:protein required for attachment to host cells